MTNNFKNLNINREKLDDEIDKFISSHEYRVNKNYKENERIISFGKAGEDFALVILYLNNTGTTTINYKVGKNQKLGEELAIYLRNTIPPEEFESVNYSLPGICEKDLQPILDLMREEEHLDIQTTCDKKTPKKITKITHKIHRDSISITHHSKSNKLQIQGKPLTCYKIFIFGISGLLNIKGLEKVLCHKENGSAEIVRVEMAEDYLKKYISKYDQLPESVKKLLISSCCIKLASPELPDYCLLLYPDLRALEGLLKQRMSGCDMTPNVSKNNFGNFFCYHRDRGYHLRSKWAKKLTHDEINTFNQAYSLFNKHRHTLFHMEVLPDSSRMINTLGNAIDLSKERYAMIDKLS